MSVKCYKIKAIVLQKKINFKILYILSKIFAIVSYLTGSKNCQNSSALTIFAYISVMQRDT